MIFITAHPDDRTRTRAREVNAVAYLEKPVDEETLLAALEQALERIAGSRRPRRPTPRKTRPAARRVSRS